MFSSCQSVVLRDLGHIAEKVRVRHQHAALAAIDLERQAHVFPDVHDAVSDTFAPMAKDSTPLTVVGTSTSITWPRRGSLVTVQVELAVEAWAVTR